VVQSVTGGGFGGKEEYPNLIAGHAALLAKATGKPVKILYDRAEDMVATTKRHPGLVRHRTGLSKDGRLLGMEVELILDGGAYVTLSPVVLSRATLHAAGPYRCDHVTVVSKVVQTHTPPNGAFRGFGVPQAAFALERHMDVVARRLAIDPLELRRRNVLRDGETTATGQAVADAGGAGEALEAAVERVVAVIRAEHPQVVVTYDERGGYGHPDHIRAHQVAVAAFEASGDPRRFPAAGAPWTPIKLYYTVFPRSAMERFAERLRAAGIEPPFARAAEENPSEAPQPQFGVADDQVTTVVDVSAYVQAKRAALEAHRTQMGPEQFFMKLPPEFFAEAFGRETYQRVAGPGSTPETDLFDGLP